MQLTPHFSLEELIVTETRLPNIPDALEINQLKLLADYLEKVRTALGNHPIIISSAYRSEAVNEAVGGVSDSAHRLCYAADFTCPGHGTVYQVARDLEGLIEYDQLIYEQTWVHVSRDPRLRSQMLTYSGGDYKSGLWA